MSEVKGNFNLMRMRSSRHVRELVQRLRPSHKQMIQPLFVVEGLREREPVKSLRGVYRDSDESVLKQIEADLEAGVSKFILFGVPNTKGTYEFETSAEQIRSIKRRFGHDIWLSADVCLCSWSEHGHCGVLDKDGNHIDHHPTLQLLAKQAVSFAQAGVDGVAPSDMMDGRIAALRGALDTGGFERVLLMSYAVKFHSKFYGPFRLAADSAPTKEGGLRDRASYQIDPCRAEDALACALRDDQEGADILMVKPGMPYLDILAEVTKKVSHKPWAVYQVSGEYGAIELMAEQGLMDGPAAHVEAWTGFIRAGASMIITYGARQARSWLEND